MRKTVNIFGEIYVFEEVHLFHGRGSLDRKTAARNLLDVHRLLSKTNIRWGLFFGTLLGAIREGNFIAHDEDTDIFILKEDAEAFYTELPKLLDLGFSIARHDNQLFSLIRDGDYIDFYFLRRKGQYRRVGDYKFPGAVFQSPEKVFFLGQRFPAPQNPEELLVEWYGSNWRQPLAGLPARGEAEPRAKTFIKKQLPGLYVILRIIKATVRGLLGFPEKVWNRLKL